MWPLALRGLNVRSDVTALDELRRRGHSVTVLGLPALWNESLPFERVRAEPASQNGKV